jgi:RNA polymerase sigma factor (sigma-70 family)
MTIEQDDPEALHRSMESEETERLCSAVGGLVGRMLMREYGMTETEVTAVLQDAFYGYVYSKESLENGENWLVAAICARAFAHLRLRGLESAGNPEDETEHMRDLVFTRAAVAALPERAREAIRLRFDEKLSYPEIAKELGVTVPAARRFVANAVALLRKWQR